MIRPFARLYRCVLPLAVVALYSLAPTTLLADTPAAHIQSQPDNAITAQAARESASAQTLELLSLHKRWLKAPASEVSAPGESASTTLTVTSPSSATDGYYDIGVTGANCQ